ncbi:nitrile hydratase [Rhodococcus sp. 06-621-2]|nr:ABC transporter substrate-binding protein [Rhodococcus sp. 06-621-2]OZC58748.1 nitrile hydratase [Rhodococcus sp. 06-621-2]
MAGFSVTAHVASADPPSLAFDEFERGRLLDFECVRLTVGAAVALSLPIGDPAAAADVGSMPITLLGHVAGVKRGRSVSIVHHQPWRGRLKVRFFPDGTGTRIVVESSLGDDGISWLANKRGFAPLEPPRTDRHRIGLLVSKSGSAAVFAQATEALAALAVEEINADGGIDGVDVELMTEDDASDSATGAAAAIRLMRNGCRAVFACVTSATFNAAAAVLNDTDVLLVHTVLNEGGPPSAGLVRLGERPLDQVRAGVPALMADSGCTRWFFVGHRYSWSYGAHRAARQAVADAGGSVVGESYTPLGTTDFSDTIGAIVNTGSELILSSLVGHDEVFFERQCAESGLRSSTRTFALVLDEATQQLIGHSDAEGVWAAFSYFQSAADDSELLDRYSGPLLPPLSSLSKTTYQAILAYAHAATGTTVGDRASIRSLLLDTPSRFTRFIRRPILLAESRRGTLHTR